MYNKKVKVLTSMVNNRIVDVFKDSTTEKEISSYILEHHKDDGNLTIKCTEISPLGVHKFSVNISSPKKPTKLIQYLLVLYQPNEFR